MQPNLTAYLVKLAELLGYDVDLAELAPATGLYPEPVLAWAEAGTRHATIAHMRTLLAAPIALLRGDPAGCAADQHLLASLLDRDQHYDEELDHASWRYAAACHALLGTGLVWLRPSHTAGTPLQHQRADPEMTSSTQLG